MYNRILIPTDGSAYSANAARYALDIAEKYGATLHVVSVIDTNTGLLGPGVESTQNVLETRSKEAIGEIESLAADENVELVSALLKGIPAVRIQQYANRENIDLIVMGTHGRTGIGRYLLGSVTEQITRNADIPVMTVSISDDESILTDGEEATETAREALETEGYSDLSFPEEPSQEHNFWVVRATSGDETFNIHINKTTGESNIVPVDG